MSPELIPFGEEKDRIVAYVKFANRAILKAKEDLKGEYIEWCIIETFYAMIHVANAFLAIIGKTPEDHKERLDLLIANFGPRSRNTVKIPEKYIKALALTYMAGIRLHANYYPHIFFAQYTKERVERIVFATEAYVHETKLILKEACQKAKVEISDDELEIERLKPKAPFNLEELRSNINIP
ncbi:MAG: hypothetical protein QME47_07800 [Candidatus Thermoplasmatota archaeon]|nr:hypothetical protein [Candidatus Thermoplasmatota archaeon]